MLEEIVLLILSKQMFVKAIRHVLKEAEGSKTTDFISVTITLQCGSVAQWLALQHHDKKMPGSIPGLWPFCVEFT